MISLLPHIKPHVRLQRARSWLGLLLLAASLTSASPAVWAAPSKKAAPKERIHIVGRGHTLWVIAKIHGVPVELIQQANDLAPGQLLKIGTKLVIPSKDTPLSPSKSQKHAPENDTAGRKGKFKAESNSKPSAVILTPEWKKDRKRIYRLNKQFATAPPPSTYKAAKGNVRKGQIQVTYLGQTWKGYIKQRFGQLNPRAIHGLSSMLRSRRTGAAHEIHPRLIALLGIVSDHFGGRAIQVVSAYRPPSTNRFTKNSRHNHGRAIDFHVAGISNKELRDFCLHFKNVGVGFYPNSSFIHLDIREKKTTWVDFAGPGEAPVYGHMHQGELAHFL
jgi:uncharacterized protein YcbK (DUF882 family)/LysM repeat protein